MDRRHLKLGELLKVVADLNDVVVDLIELMSLKLTDLLDEKVPSPVVRRVNRGVVHGRPDLMLIGLTAQRARGERDRGGRSNLHPRRDPLAVPRRG